MVTRDTPEAALAAALDRCWRTFQGDYAPGDLGRLAAAILAALDAAGFAVVPKEDEDERLAGLIASARRRAGAALAGIDGGDDFMVTRDTPEAALAAALAGIGASDIDTMIWSPFLWPHPEDADVPLDPYPFASLAAAILVALDGWTLVPTGTIEGHRVCEENMDAEIARLREFAEWAVDNNGWDGSMSSEFGRRYKLALAPSEP